MTTSRRFALVAALALLPILPYLLLGYTGHDLPFHVCSWLDVKASWVAGHFNPGWSAPANFGRGDPHLTFYPPISFYLGAVLALFLPLKLAPAAYVWIALVLSGLSMYIASKPFVAEHDRLVAAILYMLGPYTITTSLIRFAAAELLVQAWLPLIALYFYKAIGQPRNIPSDHGLTNRRAPMLLALLLGLSWATNIPASIVLIYSLALATVFCAVLQRSLRPLLRLVLVQAVAVTLAAFYLLPLWKERTWIHPDTLLRIDPSQLLLFMPHYKFNDSPLLVVCWLFLCAEILLAIACFRRRLLPLYSEPAVSIWACLAAGSFILQSPLAIPLWEHAPELQYVQFPLRFLSIIGVAVPFLLLSRGTSTSIRLPAYTLMAALSIIPFIGYLSEQAVAVNRSLPLPELLASWQRRGAPEYLPAGTLMPIGPTSLAGNSFVDTVNPLVSDPSCQVKVGQQTSDLRVFQTVSGNTCRIRLTTYFYPYWRATDELHNALVVSRESTGFLLVDVPLGSHTISVTFQPASSIRAKSRLISLIALLLLGIAFLTVGVIDKRSLLPPAGL